MSWPFLSPMASPSTTSLKTGSDRPGLLQHIKWCHSHQKVYECTHRPHDPTGGERLESDQSRGALLPPPRHLHVARLQRPPFPPALSGPGPEPPSRVPSAEARGLRFPLSRGMRQEALPVTHRASPCALLLQRPERLFPRPWAPEQLQTRARAKRQRWRSQGLFLNTPFARAPAHLVTAAITPHLGQWFNKAPRLPRSLLPGSDQR